MAKVADKIRLIVDWAPALSLVSEISAAKSSKGRADAALKLMRFVATKTETPIDDDLLERIEAVLVSPQGEELFRYCCALIEGIANMEVPE